MQDPRLMEWLEAANLRYQAQELPAIHRPFKACSEYSVDFKQNVMLQSPVADAIFKWFYARSDYEAHLIGRLFSGVFYYDAYFWPLHIPISYGQNKIEPLACLQTMPEALKTQIRKNQQPLDLYFADCFDYGNAISEIATSVLFTNRAKTLLESADKELIGALTQLIVPRPNTKAILGLRMASEIFMKALLVQDMNLSEQDLKGLGHRIDVLAQKCFDVTEVDDFKTLANSSSVYPDIADRYQGAARQLSEVGEAVRVTQTIASSVMRRYTPHNMRATVLEFYN
jgi:hypothetical protein